MSASLSTWSLGPGGGVWFLVHLRAVCLFRADWLPLLTAPPAHFVLEDFGEGRFELGVHDAVDNRVDCAAAVHQEDHRDAHEARAGAEHPLRQGNRRYRDPADQVCTHDREGGLQNLDIRGVCCVDWVAVCRVGVHVSGAGADGAIDLVVAENDHTSNAVDGDTCNADGVGNVEFVDERANAEAAVIREFSPSIKRRSGEQKCR